LKQGDLSKFIEDAGRRRVLQCIVQNIRARNADPGEIQRIVDEAINGPRGTPPQKPPASLICVAVISSCVLDHPSRPAAIVDAWLEGEFAPS
jgi:hypothetical protein